MAQVLGTSGNDNLDYDDGVTDGSDTIYGYPGADILFGRGGNDVIHGGTDDDTIYGGLGNDILTGGAGADVIDGGDGIDTASYYDAYTGVTVSLATGRGYFGDSADDTLTSIENLLGSVFTDLLVGNAAANTISGSGGNDIIRGGGGSDILDGGNGVDTVDYSESSQGVTVSLVAGATLAGGDAAGDQINGFENLTGSAFGDTLWGDAGNNVLSGLAGSDTMKGAGGADRLDGGAGADTMQGGADDDVYVVDDLADIVDETTAGASGFDTVETTISLDLGNAGTFKGSIEALRLTGASDINGTGNTLDNWLIGNAGINLLTGGAGNDVLDGGGGADILRGGAGNDTYVVDSTADRVNESIAGSDGNDTVQAAFTFSLADITVIQGAVENLTLLGAADINGTGNALDNILTGNAGANILTGAAGNDTLDGAAGADTMRGGAGNDVYGVDDAGDVVDEGIAGSGGIDTIRTALSYDLAASPNAIKGYIENLTLIGTRHLNGGGNGLNNAITGNAGNNTLEGRAGNDTLDGGGGADILIGGTGNDIYYVDIAEDAVIEAAGGGLDRVQASVDYVLAAGAYVELLSTRNAAGIEAMDLTGNGFAQTITGNAGANFLDGGGGNDTLIGGAGNDTLIGGGGTDTLRGGAGDDSYLVDGTQDVIDENAAGSGGLDTVLSSVSFSLADTAIVKGAVENLTLLGAEAINGTGNALDNALAGNDGANILAGGAGNDRLDGGGGADILRGGAGSDIYVAGDAGDVFDESAAGSGGSDTVLAAMSYDLAAPPNIIRGYVENLTLTGTGAFNGGGNGLGNVITGNNAANTLRGEAGNDTLDGGLGADTLLGGTGNDIFIVDSNADKVRDEVGEGNDQVRASASFGLFATAEIELLKTTNDAGTAAIDLRGNAFNQTIIGNAGANRLDGNGGADILQGGGGADVLAGGTGADRLTGGAGADSFVYGSSADSNQSGTGRDVITDFSRTEGDKVSLVAIDADTLTAGDQAFSFVGTAGFSRHAGELRMSIVNGSIYIYGDTNGDGGADFSVQLANLTTVQASDFVL